MELWEQQPGEGARAYQAAKIYFELGAERSLSAVASKLSKSDTLIKRWSRRHEWVERAESYDQHMAAVEQAALEEEARRQGEEKAAAWIACLDELRKKEWETSQAMIKRVETMLKWPIEEQRVVGTDGESITIIAPAKWRARDAATLLLAASKLGRLATGAETDRTGTIDVNSLSDEELERVAKTGRL